MWARYLRLQRFRPARVDARNQDGSLDLSYPYELGSAISVDKEKEVQPVLESEEEGGEPTVIVKPLTDHERLVDFMGRFHVSAKTKFLDLSGFHMTEFLDYDGFRSGFKYVVSAGWFTRGLTSLDLSYNRLSTLPLSISHLTALTLLDLKCNCLIALPETLSALSVIATVDVSFNHLTVLPCGLGISPALRQIIAHHNTQLLAPPHEILKQGASVVAHYLASVHTARKTGRLDWSGLGLCTLDTLLVMLPDGDASLIVELYLDDNFITMLHQDVLSELLNVEVIRCCRNYLTALHPNIGTFCPKLEQITLDGNRLR